MVDRIERIARTKPIDSGIGHFFERKDGYEENRKNRRSFEQDLSREITKKAQAEELSSTAVPKAYQLDLTIKPTQSLFYEDKVDLTRAKGKMHDAG